MPGTIHEAEDSAKIIILVIGIVFLAVIVLAFVFQYEHISFLGLNLINVILSLPEAILNFFTNGINAVSQFFIHLLQGL